MASKKGETEMLAVSIISLVAVALLVMLVFYMRRELIKMAATCAEATKQIGVLNAEIRIRREKIAELEEKLSGHEALKARFDVEHKTLVEIVEWIRLTSTRMMGNFITIEHNGSVKINGKLWGHSAVNGRITNLTPPQPEKGHEQRFSIS